MQRAWSAMLFSAVGLMAIVYGMTNLLQVHLKMSFWSRSDHPGWVVVLGILCTWVVPSALLILGAVLFLRPPGRKIIDPPDFVQSERGPELALTVGIMVSGIYLFGNAGARLTRLLADRLTERTPEEHISAAGIVAQALVTGFGLYLAVGAPHLKRWLIGRVRLTTPATPEGLPEKYVCAGLMVVGALLVGDTLDVVIGYLLHLPTADSFWQFIQRSSSVFFKFLLGLYLLSGGKAIRAFQLGLLDRPPEEAPADELADNSSDPTNR